jgi:hypothetical protein
MFFVESTLKIHPDGVPGDQPDSPQGSGLIRIDRAKLKESEVSDNYALTHHITCFAWSSADRENARYGLLKRKN